MGDAQNIYDYNPPKSSNVEVSYFLTKGRITGKAFFLRLLLVLSIWGTSNMVMQLHYIPLYQYWEREGEGKVRNQSFLTRYQVFHAFNYYCLTSLLGLFLLIQGAKRIHDVNSSGWYMFVPLYNIVLLFSSGTKGNNDYGLNPRPQKVVKYFDELKEIKK